MGSGDVWRQQQGPTVFVPFKEDTDYFGSNQQFMVNLRVEGLDSLLERLAAGGVHIDDDRQEISLGKFAWIYDPEGNKIELWEPSSGCL